MLKERLLIRMDVLDMIWSIGNGERERGNEREQIREKDF